MKSCTTEQKFSQPVGEERRDDGDAVGGGEPECVDEEEELHEAVVGPVAPARLHHVHVLAAHVLQQLHARLLVGELGESARKVGNCRLIYWNLWDTYLGESYILIRLCKNLLRRIVKLI